jgi:hypothetical protein
MPERPDWKEKIGRRLAPLKLAPTREAEIVEEVAQHLEDRYQELLAGEAAETEARHGALDELSDEELLTHSLRRVEQEAPKEPDWAGGGGASNFLASFGQDLRYGLRMFWKNPGLTAVLVAMLALGIGANTAIFSAVDAVLLKPLPFRSPGQLLRVFEANDRAGISASGCSYLEFQEWQRQNHVFSGMAAVAAHELNLTGRGEPMVVRVGDVTSDFFSVLGVPPLMGRAFLPADDQPGAAPVAVIGEDLWRSRFGADPGLMGSSIDLDERSFTVVGVMPGTFRFSFLEEGLSRQVWIPFVQDPLFGGRGTEAQRKTGGCSAPQAARAEGRTPLLI